MAGTVAAWNAPGHLTAVMLSKDPGGGLRGLGLFFSSINHEKGERRKGKKKKRFCSFGNCEIN